MPRPKSKASVSFKPPHNPYMLRPYEGTPVRVVAFAAQEYADEWYRAERPPARRIVLKISNPPRWAGDEDAVARHLVNAIEANPQMRHIVEGLRVEVAILVRKLQRRRKHGERRGVFVKRSQR